MFPTNFTDIMITHEQMVSFALDIARGMAFLHAMEPLIPGYHLNSKNIMVSTLLLVLPTDLREREEGGEHSHA